MALCAGLTACGGGGGSGGSTPAPVVPLTATVSVNGSAAAPGTDGQYAVKPGDTVEIVPSQAADWTGTGSDAAVTLRNATTTPTKWSARILNAKPQTFTYTASAKASANASLTKDIVLKVAAGDARNGEYRVYATSGLKLKLRMDFDIKAYDMVAEDGTTLSDDFIAVADEPRTFAFKSSRVSTVANIARFRVVTDGVIGAFPFNDAFVAGSHPIRPFIAVRKLVTQQANLAGVYNRVGVQRLQDGTSSSNIMQMQVMAGGSQLVMCRSQNIYDIANCAPADLSVFTVTASDEAGIWNIVNVANAADGGRIAIADVGGERMYLSAGKTTPDMAVWRIGVLDAPDWTAATAYGASTTQTWGKTVMTPTDYVRTTLNLQGESGSATSFTSLMGASRPAGMRQISISSAPGNTYFGVRNSKVFAVVGASNATTGGYVMINAFE